VKVNPAIQGRLTRVATGNVGRPRLSADGSTVVYPRWNGENWDIERNRDGQMEAVSKDPRNDLSPQVSGDGDVVVFSRYNPESRDGKGSWDVHRWENGKETPVANSSANESDPDISSDGQTVVFTYDDLDKRTGFDIHRCRNGQCEELTTDWPVDTNSQVADGGDRVIFRRKVRFDGGDLWLSDQSGTVKQLTKDGLAEQRPSFSADGTKLAYSKSLDGENEDIFLHNLSNGQLLTIGAPDTNERDPELSADGSVLVFSQSGNGVSSIVVRDSEGSQPLTEGGFHRSPAVSADGRVVAWVGVDDKDSSHNVIYKFERS
jgi:Tol biopolymer transport system component